MSRISRSPSYLIRNTHSYCFRIRIPQDLHNIIGKKELRYSLKTGYLGVAKSRARVLAVISHELFSKIREVLALSGLTDQDITRLINTYVREHKKRIIII